jgi:hypothetical protein
VIDRLRTAPPAPEAVAIAGACLTLAGLAVAADALTGTAVPQGLGGLDRIMFGLWRFQLGQALTLTVGLGLLVVGLEFKANLGGWREPVARAAAGVAIGATLVATAVVLASTYVVLVGHVGGTSVTGSARLFTWVRQLVTAVGFGAVWLLAAAWLSQVAAVEYTSFAAQEEDESPEPQAVPAPDPQLVPEPEPKRKPVVVTTRQPVIAPPPPTVVAAAAPEHVLPADISSPSARARTIYAERLSFSPRAAVAETMLAEVTRLERDGKQREAEVLVRRMQEM